MFKSRLIALRVGIVIALAIGLFCFSIFSIGYGSRYLRRTIPLQAHFARANGLQAGAPVSLGGVNIGAVSSISLPRDPDANYIVVRMWIEEAAFARLRTNSTACIRTMGLLGDKFVEITDGTRAAPRLAPGAVISSINPVDYEALLQKEGTQDVIGNLITISAELSTLLKSINEGHSLLGELVRGEPVPPGQQLTLADIRSTFTNVNSLAIEMDGVMRKINRGSGLMGAMFSDKFDGRRLLRNLDGAVTSVQTAAASVNGAGDSLNKFASEYERAQGALPRLFKDREFGDEIIANLRASSADLHEILAKLNSGRGTLGLAINDPQLYNNAAAFLGGSGPGWGLRFFSLLYDVTHPFANQEPAPPSPVEEASIAGPVADPPGEHRAAAAVAHAR